MQFERSALLAALCLLGVGFAILWGRSLTGSAARRESAGAGRARKGFFVAVGFVTDFLDTLGIGSFATTASLYRLSRKVDDRVIPGTMNVGHTLPTIVQALIFVTIIRTDMTTTVVMIGASVGGAWLGSGRVRGFSRRAVQAGMGSALVCAAVILSLGSLGRLPSGGDALELQGGALVAGVCGNFVFGALMTLGVGLYAPCMILVTLLGMSPRAAFPIMMGSCAFLMPVGSFRFVKGGAYDPAAAVGLTLGGIPAVLVAAFAVRALPLGAMRWLVAGVAAYTAITLLSDARKPDVADQPGGRKG